MRNKYFFFCKFIMRQSSWDLLGRGGFHVGGKHYTHSVLLARNICEQKPRMPVCDSRRDSQLVHAGWGRTIKTKVKGSYITSPGACGAGVLFRTIVQTKLLLFQLWMTAGPDRSLITRLSGQVAAEAATTSLFSPASRRHRPPDSKHRWKLEKRIHLWQIPRSLCQISERPRFDLIGLRWGWCGLDILQRLHVLDFQGGSGYFPKWQRESALSWAWTQKFLPISSSSFLMQSLPQLKPPALPSEDLVRLGSKWLLQTT